MSAAVAKLQALADEAARQEAEVMDRLRPIADLGNALVAAYRSRGVAAAEATRLALALVPIILAAGDRP